jgi:rhomboid protease GluP
VTAIFLHAGLLHFAFNSFMLIQLGPLVEQIYGTDRFWVVYLACGIGGSLASQLPRPVLTVGASGAIMGLVGLLLVYGYRSGSVLGQSMKQLTLRLVAYTLLMGLLVRGARIDHLAHVGGFVTGAALALLVPAGVPRTRAERTAWQWLALAGIGLVLLGFYRVAVAARFSGGA